MNALFSAPGGEIPFQFIDKGTKQTVVLIHGFMEDQEIWLDILPNLNANVLSMDLLGFGKSVPQPDFDFSMQHQAIAISSLLRHLGLKNGHVIGHSMGGYVTMELLKSHPEFSACLLHSTCYPDTQERIENRNKTLKVLQSDPDIFIREFYWNLFAPQKKKQYATIVDKLKQKAQRIPTQNIIETVKALRDRKDHLETWKSIQAPKMIISGKYDQLVNHKEMERLATNTKSSWLELSNSGHMGFYEEPDKLINGINNWISS